MIFIENISDAKSSAVYLILFHGLQNPMQYVSNPHFYRGEAFRLTEVNLFTYMY